MVALPILRRRSGRLTGQTKTRSYLETNSRFTPQSQTPSHRVWRVHHRRPRVHIVKLPAASPGFGCHGYRLLLPRACVFICREDGTVSSLWSRMSLLETLQLNLFKDTAAAQRRPLLALGDGGVADLCCPGRTVRCGSPLQSSAERILSPAPQKKKKKVSGEGSEDVRVHPPVGWGGSPERNGRLPSVCSSCSHRTPNPETRQHTHVRAPETHKHTLGGGSTLW